MAKYVSCTKDLPNGVTAGKRYEMLNETGRAFEIADDDGDIRFCLKEDCAHLRDGAKWVFHDEAEEVPAMKHKVGDRVRVLSGGYDDEEGFRNGDVFTVTANTTRPEGGGFIHGGDHENFIFFATEVEPVEEDKTAADLTLSVDIPIQAMKEFADHCERAAAALERIKDILA